MPLQETREESEVDEVSETHGLKRSSTAQSKASLVSSSSSRSSVPPVITPKSQPSAMYLPEMRQSSFSVDSGTSGFELGER